MIKARWSRRLSALIAVPALTCGSLVAMAFASALPAQACGTIPISGTQYVAYPTWALPPGSIEQIPVANVQLWYNGCTAGNRFVYATMNFDPPRVGWYMPTFTLVVGIEDELGNFPFGKTVVNGKEDSVGDCASGCQAIAHAVNIDYYGSPKKFRAWASINDYPGCSAEDPIATDWWEFSTGTDENNGVSAYCPGPIAG
jgi:hypothetical protein